MTDYVNAYAIPALKIRGNDDSSQPELDAFLFATDQYQYRSKGPKSRLATAQKYRKQLSSTVEKLVSAKKRSNAVTRLLERFPELVETLQNEERPILEELMALAESILKNPVHTLVLQRGALRAPPEPPDLPVLLLTTDTSNGRAALLYTEEDGGATYVFPPEHRLLQVIRAADDARRASEDEEAPQIGDASEEEEDTHEPAAELYHIDELEFEPFEGELEVDRELPPPPAQMERTHLLADMLKLVPDNPHVALYTQVLLDSLRPERGRPRFLHPRMPLVRVDPLERTQNSAQYVLQMQDFAKATNSARPYVMSVFRQLNDPEGAILLDADGLTERRDAVLDDLRAQLHRRPVVDVTYCHKNMSRVDLERFARIYGVKISKNKRRMCELLEPYLDNIAQVLNEEDSVSADCEAEAGEFLIEEAPGEAVPYHTAGFLREDRVRTKGVLYMGDPKAPREFKEFDLDAYREHLRRAGEALPVRCELRHFAPEGSTDPSLSEQGEVLELLEDDFLRVRTDGGRETFYNLRAHSANTFFLYTASYAGERFHKKDLGDQNVLFLSEALTEEAIQELVGLTLHQYLYIRRRNGFVDTPLQHDFSTTAGIQEALRALFGIPRIEHLSRQEFELLRDSLEGADLPALPKARAREWVRLPGAARTPFPFMGAEIMRELREPPVLTSAPSAYERLGALRALNDYPSKLVLWAQNLDLRRTTGCDYSFPSFQTPHMDPPGTVLHFESMEALRQHRRELEPYLQFKAESDLRRNAQAVRASCDSLEQIHRTHTELMLQADRFGSLSRRRESPELRVLHAPHRATAGDLDEDEVFTTVGDEQIQYVAPLRQAPGARGHSLTDRLVEILQVPMNQADRRYVESEHAPYKVLLLNLVAAQKKGGATKPSPQLEQYLEVCARCNMIAVYLMSKRDLFPLAAKHARHFSFDGFPLEGSSSKGVALYVAHVICDAYPENPLFESPQKVEKTIRAAMSYFLRKYPSVRPMLLRKAKEAREKADTLRAEPRYRPLPDSKIVEKVRKETLQGELDRSFRMFRPGGTRDSDRFLYPALVAIPAPWNRHAQLEPAARIRQGRTVPLEVGRDADAPAATEEADQRELRQLLDQLGDWASLEEFVRVTIRTPRNAQFHRVNVNQELGRLVFSEDHPYEFLNRPHSRALMEKHAVRNDPARGAAHNTLLMLRSTGELLRELFSEESKERSSPFTIRQYIREPPEREAYEALQRAWGEGVARLIREVRYNTVDETELREHSDVLRDADKQRALDLYADMDMDSRMVVKMVKDLVGVQPAEPAGAPEDHDFRDVRPEDEEQEE